ncbi:MAG TPA: hypothetical protein VL426_00385 [Candidatus Binatia bacterium]|jgi:hypothetical protein|nr:hypothetical protein [Candidatus Binatia bacterium]
MRMFRPGIAATLAVPKGDGPLIGRFMRDAEPLFRIAESGSYPLAEGERLNDANVAVAIASATLAPAHGIMPISSANEAVPPDWRFERHYRTFLSHALRQNRRDAFDAAHGPGTLAALVDPLWKDFGAAYVAALQSTHEEFLGQFDMAMASDIAFGPLVAATYAAGFAACGDAQGYAAMRGLLKLLPWAVPVGMPEGAGRKWLVLVS